MPNVRAAVSLRPLWAERDSDGDELDETRRRFRPRSFPCWLVLSVVSLDSATSVLEPATPARTSFACCGSGSQLTSADPNRSLQTAHYTQSMLSARIGTIGRCRARLRGCSPTFDSLSSMALEPLDFSAFDSQNSCGEQVCSLPGSIVTSY